MDHFSIEHSELIGEYFISPAAVKDAVYAFFQNQAVQFYYP